MQVAQPGNKIEKLAKNVVDRFNFKEAQSHVEKKKHQVYGANFDF